MKYYIIAGEASGDLHGANLMKNLYIILGFTLLTTNTFAQWQELVQEDNINKALITINPQHITQDFKNKQFRAYFNNSQKLFEDYFF